MIKSYGLIYDENIEKVPGETNSSIREKVMASATVFNPNVTKIKEIVKNKLDKLLVTSLTYIYSLPFQLEDFDKKCMQKLQDNYSIISYDFEEGAMIEYDSNFFLSVKCTLEQIQIKLQTEYKAGNIREEDMTDEEHEKLIDLYKKQNKEFTDSEKATIFWNSMLPYNEKLTALKEIMESTADEILKEQIQKRLETEAEKEKLENEKNITIISCYVIISLWIQFKCTKSDHSKS